jgi:hypothetical protein
MLNVCLGGISATPLGIKHELNVHVVLDVVLIDQQSVGKRSLHLMDTVNAKKRWTIIYWRVNKFLKETYTYHIVILHTPCKERASFLKINNINDISFLGTPDCHHCCSIAIAGMLILWVCMYVPPCTND